MTLCQGVISLLDVISTLMTPIVTSVLPNSCYYIFILGLRRGHKAHWAVLSGLAIKYKAEVNLRYWE